MQAIDRLLRKARAQPHRAADLFADAVRNKSLADWELEMIRPSIDHLVAHQTKKFNKYHDH